LIEYVINTFIKKPHSLQSSTNFRLDTENFDDDKIFLKPGTVSGAIKCDKNETDKKENGGSKSSKDRSLNNCKLEG
jgi:hypothetical protein